MVSEVKNFFSELNAHGRIFALKKQKSKTYFPVKRPGRFFFGKLRYSMELLNPLPTSKK